MKIVAISDVHCRWKNLIIPECDVLISTGDYSFQGQPDVVLHFHEWLGQQNAHHIISVQGNHEVWVEKNFGAAKAIAEGACPGVYFMQEGPIEIGGVKFWCASVTPWFHDWAWNVRRGPDIKRHWDLIPEDTNVLLTHGPPYGILDIVPYADGTPKERAGCHDLKDRIAIVKPDIHIFGHIHHSHGQHHEDGTSYYNASICDEQYAPTNPVTVIDYELELHEKSEDQSGRSPCGPASDEGHE